MRTILVLLLTIIACRSACADGGAIRVQVDHRVELMSIVARLAGNREYTMPNSQSPYAERVAAAFAPFSEHRAITLTGKLFTVRTTFEAGRTYRFSLNAGRFQGFAAQDGSALEAVEVEWRVGAAEQP